MKHSGEIVPCGPLAPNKWLAKTRYESILGVVCCGPDFVCDSEASANAQACEYCEKNHGTWYIPAIPVVVLSGT